MARNRYSFPYLGLPQLISSIQAATIVEATSRIITFKTPRHPPGVYQTCIKEGDKRIAGDPQQISFTIERNLIASEEEPSDAIYESPFGKGFLLLLICACFLIFLCKEVASWDNW